MAFVPWGDALSVDQLFRRISRRPSNHSPGQRYGLATWIPIFMLGLAYFAAAFAKLDETGLRWITEGAVRYFMVVDAPNAPGTLGRFIASREWLAVMVSAGAVASEVFIVAAAIWPTATVTVVAGLCAFLLHEGFWLCQGVFWYPWWALLPAFVPWNASRSRLQWLTPRGATSLPLLPSLDPPSQRRATSESAACVGALALFGLQQPLVSFAVFERLPFVSHYPMYSDVNWDSREHFARGMEEERQPAPAIRLEPTDGLSPDLFASHLRSLDAHDIVSDMARRVSAGGELSDSERDELARVMAVYVGRFGVGPPAVVVSIGHWRFDWAVADFVPRNDWQPKATLTLIQAGGDC